MPSKRDQLEAAGHWLRQARERRGFATLGDFARELGVDPSLISRYERGMSAVPDERAEDIARILGVDIITVRRNLGLWVPADSDEAPTTDERMARLEEKLDRAYELLDEARRDLRGETA